MLSLCALYAMSLAPARRGWQSYPSLMWVLLASCVVLPCQLCVATASMANNAMLCTCRC